VWSRSWAATAADGAKPTTYPAIVGPRRCQHPWGGPLGGRPNCLTERIPVGLLGFV
jgi:hypothetical protein